MRNIKKGKDIGRKSRGERYCSFELLKCPDCNKERWVRLKFNIPISNYCRICRLKYHQFGKDNAQWKERRITAQGYLIRAVSKDSPYFSMRLKGTDKVLEHRLVFAQSIGRCLTKKEYVHHLNGNRQDNRLENLGLVTSKNHEKNTLTNLLKRRIQELEVLLLKSLSAS